MNENGGEEKKSNTPPTRRHSYEEKDITIQRQGKNTRLIHFRKNGTYSPYVRTELRRVRRKGHGSHRSNKGRKQNTGRDLTISFPSGEKKQTMFPIQTGAAAPEEDPGWLGGGIISRSKNPKTLLQFTFKRRQCCGENETNIDGHFQLERRGTLLVGLLPQRTVGRPSTLNFGNIF